MVQPLGPGLLIAIVRAVIAPVSSAGPIAATHSPTASALDVALAVLVYVVDELIVTVVSADWPARGFVLCTVNPVALTAVTEPKERPPGAPGAPGAPLGRGRLLGRGALLGRPAPLPPPPPNAPAVQPFEDDGVSETDRAVSVAGMLPPDVAVTATHDPTVTSASVAAVVFVNVVLPLKFTVT